jgi:hypothetical protein
MIRIRSEHAIGFLKGRFASLKNLRVNIKNERLHKFATYWIASCIGLHAFAMLCESGQDSDTEDMPHDPFIGEGLSSDSDSDNNQPPAGNQTASARRLNKAKKHREKLKRRLFRAKDLM